MQGSDSRFDRHLVTMPENTVSRRILMVAARYLPLMGGIETHVYETARRMAARGHDVEVLATDLTGDLARADWCEGIRIRRVSAYPKNSDIRFAPSIYSTIERGTWDVIHIQGYHTLVAPIAALGALRRRIPFVVTFHSGGHSSRLRNSLRSAQRAVLRPLFSRAHQLIGVSEYEADFFSETLHVAREKFAVVPNGAGLPPATARTERHSATAPLILAVGRLERYKGHHRAIEAMPHFLAKYPDAKLRIVGQGPHESELRALIEKLGLKDSVTIGGIPSSDRHAMANLMSNASLMVLLSDYEAHPVAVLEALSIGLPVLVTQSSGFLEMIRERLVRGIPLNSSPEATAVAMTGALTEPQQPVQLALPTWDACTDRLLEIYERVIRGSREDEMLRLQGVQPLEIVHS